MDVKMMMNFKPLLWIRNPTSVASNIEETAVSAIVNESWWVDRYLWRD